MPVQERNIGHKALVVTATKVHYTVVKPVVEELKRRNWRVTVLHLERVWERVESFSMKRKRRSIASFYVKGPRRPERRMNIYAVNILSKFIFYSMKLLSTDKPNILIILSEGILPNKVAVAVAKLAGIPALLLLQLGMLGHNYECPKFLSDRISVPGDFIKDLVVNCGVNEKRVVVTGRPTYDALIRAEKDFDKIKICKKLGLDPRKKIVVYCTENFPLRESQNMAYVICRAVKSLPGLQFVIKVHPSELSLSIYEKVSRDVGVQALVTREANIYEVLYICDLMITGYSTTALDAMILGKPVVTFNFTGLEDPIPFAESGAAIGVYKEEVLKQAIQEGLYNESVKERLQRDREKFVYEQTFLRDGKATERIVALIEQMVS